jgi:ABC-type transport system substrate-binding protein
MVAVVLVVAIIVVAGVGYLVFSTTARTPSTTSSSTVSSLSSFGPSNSSVLVDDSQGGASGGLPDSLDPATGVYGQDSLVLNNVFQQLIEFTGPNSTQGVVVPALAQSYTVQGEQNYTFDLRPGVTFSNGDPVTAAVVWFSFVRNLYMGQIVELSYYLYTTEPSTSLSTTGLSLPWGLLDAVQSATGLPTTTNYKLATSVLNNMLSNFDPNNATIQKIMSYPDQAYAVTGPTTFVVRTLNPYRFFLAVAAQWGGAIVDPAYVDAHGGVQANTENSYFNLYGGLGTGPYYIASVASGYSTVVLKANPTYWGLKANNVPVVCEPPHIPEVIVNYGLPANSRSEAFATNEAQISYVDPSLLGQAWSTYGYKQYTTFNQIFVNEGPALTTQWAGLNVAEYPTNNTDFRLAVVHAVNYTELLDEGSRFNGTILAEGDYLGPLTPQWGQYYNPGNLPMYSYNIPLAISYMNQAGLQGHFSLTLPNGTVIGDTSAPTLRPLKFDVEAPITPVLQTEDTIIQTDLSKIGLSVAVQAVTPTEILAFTTPADFPDLINDGGWGPSAPDPVLGELVPMLTPIDLETWMNLTQVNNLLNSLTYQTNQTTYMQGIAELYNITYNYAPYLWLPTYDNYFLVQPYVHGIVYSPYFTPTGQYWFNTMYYGNG